MNDDDEKVYEHKLPYYSYFLCTADGCDASIYGEYRARSHVKDTGHEVMKNTGFQVVFSLDEEYDHER